MPYEPTGALDWGNFVLCKRYGQIYGLVHAVDFDHDAIDLGV
jgi:hypothetical protein